MNGAASFFGSFDASGWFGFFVALGTHYLGDYLVPVVLAVIVLCLWGILTAIFKAVRHRRG